MRKASCILRSELNDRVVVFGLIVVRIVDLDDRFLALQWQINWRILVKLTPAAPLCELDWQSGVDHAVVVQACPHPRPIPDVNQEPHRSMKVATEPRSLHSSVSPKPRTVSKRHAVAAAQAVPWALLTQWAVRHVTTRHFHKLEIMYTSRLCNTVRRCKVATALGDHKVQSSKRNEMFPSHFTLVFKLTHTGAWVWPC